MKFSDNDIHVMKGALSSAIERYGVCSKTVNGDETLNKETRRRLVEQFDRQINDASALLERIEAAETVEMDA